MNKIDGKFWDERYASEKTVYGYEPNVFFKEQLDKLNPGHILMPGDGEGRNGVYAAKNGWLVDSVDFSNVARDKALDLAKISEVNISYLVKDLAEYEPHKNYYDAAGIIFLHLDKVLSKIFFNKVVESLKPGGVLIFEAYSEEQLGRNSGGPQDLSVLYGLDEIKNIFQELNPILSVKEEIFLNESHFHTGNASVIRFVGTK
ncbi:MAG TPA: class I SAM-dependent methyltransferase [Ignavibacteriaceae bacterium]|nr:class I SAM-dependent methyltransferase [Ignavibacteriaceae bacterium]